MQHKNIKLKQVPTNYLLAPTKTQRHTQDKQKQIKTKRKETDKHTQTSKNRQTEIDYNKQTRQIDKSNEINRSKWANKQTQQTDKHKQTNKNRLTQADQHEHIIMFTYPGIASLRTLGKEGAPSQAITIFVFS